jgi:hypothetical protein
LTNLKPNQYDGLGMNACLKNPRAKQFAEIFVRLWLEKRAQGVQNPRVGRVAAMMAGYGQGSWCQSNAIQTADVMFNKLVKRSDVMEYIRELGLERIGRQWRPVQQSES